MPGEPPQLPVSPVETAGRIGTERGRVTDQARAHARDYSKANATHNPRSTTKEKRAGPEQLTFEVSFSRRRPTLFSSRTGATDRDDVASCPFFVDRAY